MKVGVTGARGFLGWHLRAHVRTRSGLVTLSIDRESFADDSQLDAFVRASDVVVHAAGMNRGSDKEIEETNRSLAERLVGSLHRQGLRRQVVYLSSTHEDADSAYGRSKRAAGQTLREYGDQSGAPVTVLVLPNIFGEFGRPFYNSVVATFCQQIASGETPRILVDRQIELVHAQKACSAIMRAIAGTTGGVQRLSGRCVSVSEVLQYLRVMASEYDGAVLPPLADEFEVELFNTYRSFLPLERSTHELAVRSDPRGYLFEAIRSQGGGQVFFSRTEPGITRGDHFHTRKIERFIVIDGRAAIRLRRLFDKKIVELEVDGDRPRAVDIPTFHTHNITNTGTSALFTAFWSNEFFDSTRPDTYAERVSER